MRILMVCLGNICRSPLAEGILRDKANTSILVDSAGTSSYHIGDSPDSRMISTAAQHKIDISTLRARQFQQVDFDSFDRIYAMDSSNYQNILALVRNTDDQEKIHMMLADGQDVPDPYFGGAQGFENVFQLLNEACERILLEIE
tara:strand:+ start:94 stop:525 length:432 start_codon:yes stop_codon:yes gene_type:complete